MRIVHLVNDLDFGGLQRIVADLSVQLKKRNHQVTVICLREVGDGIPSRELRRAGVEVMELRKPDGFHLPTLSTLAVFLKAERVAVINSHNPLVHHYAVSAGRRAGVSAILNTLHGTATLVMPALAKALFWASCLAGDAVISVSPEVGAVFTRRYRIPPRKHEVVENGIELSPFLKIIQRRDDGELIFGSVGRLVPVKDYPNLLRAFAAVHNRCPATRLRILGGGPCEPELRRAADELRISDRVEFCGFGHDVPGFLSGIDVYVSSSSSEGLPVSMIEALAAGLPIVSTAVGGVPGVAARAGNCILCPPADPEALTRALAEAVEMPDRRDNASRAREITRHHYSAERMASQYELIYQKLLACTAGSHLPLRMRDIESKTI